MITENQAVLPGTARWAELVESGREACAHAEETVSQRNWRLGDAALEIAPMGETTAPHTNAYKILGQYATEIGIDFESLLKYRSTASAWEASKRLPSTSWSVHQKLGSKPSVQQLIRPGMTVTQAHAALGHSTVGRTGPNSSPEHRADQVRAALKDPEVREELRRKPLSREDLFDLDAAAVANGGRVPSLEELNRRFSDPALDRAVGTWEEEQLSHAPLTLKDLVARLKVLAREFERIGVIEYDTNEAIQVRASISQIMDTIGKPVRT